MSPTNLTCSQQAEWLHSSVGRALHLSNFLGVYKVTIGNLSRKVRGSFLFKAIFVVVVVVVVVAGS